MSPNEILSIVKAFFQAILRVLKALGVKVKDTAPADDTPASDDPASPSDAG